MGCVPRSATKHPAPELTEQSPRLPGIAVIEYIVAGLLTVLAVVLHGVFFCHAGGLWRDEINTVNVAQMPTFAEFREFTRWDSFPILWPLVLRGYWLLGLGGTDSGLRALGLALGLGAVAALWWQSWTMRRSPPLVSLVLIGLAPTILTWGDSLRAYGFAMLLMILTFALIWRVIEKPTWPRILVAAAVALLSVNAVYYNAVLLLAFCAGAAAVGLRRRDWRLVITILALGAVCAIGVAAINYRHYTSAAEWNESVKSTFPLTWFFLKFAEAANCSGQYMVWIWLALIVLVLAACLYRWVRPAAAEPAGTQKDLAVFIITTVIVGALGYLAFLKVVSYITQPWYYISIMAMLAIALDAGLSLAVGRGTPTATLLRVARMAMVGILVAVSIGPVWQWAHLRLTNVDLVAQKLEASATRDDLILINPWWPGITFNRYYHGPTPWTTLPALSDLRVHRIDQLRERMAAEHPIDDIKVAVVKTLRSGHKVWLVGGLSWLRQGESPGEIAPAPTETYGWQEAPYIETWARQVAFVIQLHATQSPVLEEVPADGPVNPFENEPLIGITGWR